MPKHTYRRRGKRRVGKVSQISHNRETFPPGHFKLQIFERLITREASCVESCVKMSHTLFKYFKREEKGIYLPAESGPLSEVLSPIVIKEANRGQLNLKGSIVHISIQWTTRRRRK